MADFPWMKWFPRDYIADTRHLTPAQRGCYSDLLNYLFLQKGALPDDDVQLSRMCGIDVANWRRWIRPGIENLFQLVDGTWTHKRVQDELNRAHRTASARKLSGSVGGVAKAQKTKETSLANATILLEQKASKPLARTESESESEKNLSDSSSPHPPCGELALDRFPVFERLPKGSQGKNYPAEFESFWSVYPQRGTDTKKKAYGAWRKPASNGVGPEALQTSAVAYRQFLDATNGEPKLVSSWVSDEGWTASLKLPERNIDERSGSIPQTGTQPGGKHKGPASFVEASREVLALRSRQS